MCIWTLEDWGWRHKETVGKIKQEIESQSWKNGTLSSGPDTAHAWTLAYSQESVRSQSKVLGLSCVTVEEESGHQPRTEERRGDRILVTSVSRSHRGSGHQKTRSHPGGLQAVA